MVYFRGRYEGNRRRIRAPWRRYDAVGVARNRTRIVPCGKSEARGVSSESDFAASPRSSCPASRDFLKEAEVKIGFFAIGIGILARPDLITTVATNAERLNFATVWAPEHIVFLERFESQYP